MRIDTTRPREIKKLDKGHDFATKLISGIFQLVTNEQIRTKKKKYFMTPTWQKGNCFTRADTSK